MQGFHLSGVLADKWKLSRTIRWIELVAIDFDHLSVS